MGPSLLASLESNSSS